MKEERFEEFSGLISGIYRDIQKLKAKWTEPLGMKSVHIFWVYLLRNHPEGLSASELSRYSQTNRSLISRELKELIDLGYVTIGQPLVRRRHGQKLVLTQAGLQAAERISDISYGIQQRVSASISPEDLAVFYRTLQVLLKNFDRLAEEALPEAGV